MGTRILYYGLLIPLSYLPFGILYIISDVIFFVVYRLFGYRRKVVFNNIKNSFPEKDQAELRAIEKEFYRHLSDLIVESIKTFTISKEEALQRLRVKNPEVLDKFYEQGKDVVTVGGHNSNWELYAVVCALQIKHNAVALYTALTNPVFDKKMRESRSRYGLDMIPTSQKEEMLKNKKGPTIYIFGIDQCPKKRQRAYWMKFLNQDTAVQFGAEKFAREHDLPVVFGNITKVKRGYYEVVYEVLAEDVKTLETGEVMRLSTLMLERHIKEQPAYWLWSHKRWKLNKPQA
ncbi:lipid A biosynthesis acyltransferase [Fulvivirga sp. RKSG066]|uniref:lysophospholipid acyltransferase family protein n=1 Tax=Fulvivirga aurantia TaxID=2529383 RepID=UPI0012BC926B|nr:lysophospholipid acyltransferase family protein [Fulvivirga aurantia]MTI22282.1 lipid A biosynthesis acyltransferase [Fulvivirga aurantia]